MAAQRIVVTSPWKLGLFVFLLVVGTGFGLVYAWLRLLGGALELADPTWMKNFYYVCGGVAGLGLIGYLSIVANARPKEGGMRSSQQRERLLKSFGKIKDPHKADIESFQSIPPLAKALERWQQASSKAENVEESLHVERSAIDHLADRVENLGSAGLLSAREEDEGLARLVEAINGYLQQLRENPAADAGGNEFADAKRAWLDSSPELRQQQTQLLSFAQSLRNSSHSLSHGSGAHPAAGQLGSASVGRLRELREKIEALSEESSRLAIQAALQVSRLGDSGNELVQVTEEIREVSTRYQRLVPDLRQCENDAEQISAATGASGGDADPRVAALMNENASGIEHVVQSLGATFNTLSTAFGEAPVSQPVAPASQPVAPASRSIDAVLSAPIQPVAPAAAEPALSAPVDPVRSEPVARVETPEPEEVLEISDLGGHELDANGEPIYDLLEFGAAEV